MSDCLFLLLLELTCIDRQVRNINSNTSFKICIIFNASKEVPNKIIEYPFSNYFFVIGG